MTNQTGPYQFSDFTYEVLNCNEIRIKRYAGEDSSPVIPDRIGQLPVTVLGRNSFLGTPVQAIRIPESIRCIEENAFAACDQLQEVVLPCSLASMGRGVFQASEALRELSLSGKSNYYAVLEGVLYDRNECRVVCCPPALDLEMIDVPFGTEIISDSAFYCNRALKYVRLPHTLQKIEKSAFLFTDALKMIELPPYLKEIEDNAFLVGKGFRAEKQFTIFAFPDTEGYRYAQKNGICVSPLYFTVTD